MRLKEKGFTHTELLVALPIMALLGAAAMTVIFQISHVNGRNNNYMTSVRQVENAGYWISRDTQMAQSVTTDNLTSPNDFLVLRWTTWDAAGTPIYHSVRYAFQDMTGSTGKIKRYYWSSSGASAETLIAQYIYYDLNNQTFTSQASYQFPTLEIRLTASYNDVLESRQYTIVNRPYF